MNNTGQLRLAYFTLCAFREWPEMDFLQFRTVPLPCSHFTFLPVPKFVIPIPVGFPLGYYHAIPKQAQQKITCICK